MTNKLLVKSKIKELKKYSKDNWNLNIEFNVSYTMKSIKTLGSWNPSTKTMRLNPNLLEEFGTVYIDEIVVHEFAHAVVSAYYGGSVKAHGKEFKRICSHFGISGKATTTKFANSVHLKSIKKANGFTYKCGCIDREYNLTKIRHNKILRGTVYYCKTCKEKLLIAN